MYLVYCMETRGHNISYVCIENVCTNNVFVCVLLCNVCVCYVYILKMSKKKKKKKVFQQLSSSRNGFQVRLDCSITGAGRSHSRLVVVVSCCTWFNPIFYFFIACCRRCLVCVICNWNSMHHQTLHWLDTNWRCPLHEKWFQTCWWCTSLTVILKKIFFLMCKP